MEAIIELLESFMTQIVSIAIILFEYIGIGVLIYTGIVSFGKWIMKRHDTGVYLAKGLALGLEFKMGSEILRTVIVQDWSEIATVGGIIALRAALAFLLHWEIKQEEKSETAEESKEKKED